MSLIENSQNTPPRTKSRFAAATGAVLYACIFHFTDSTMIAENPVQRVALGVVKLNCARLVQNLQTVMRTPHEMSETRNRSQPAEVYARCWGTPDIV